MIKKVIIILGIFLAVIFIGAYLILQIVPPKEPKIFGVTFSEPFAKEFGLDWQKTYEAIFNDLRIRFVRIPVYWPEVETQENKFIFDDYDWQLEKAQEYGVKVILAIGRKLPRWPECFEAGWVQELYEELYESRSRKILTRPGLVDVDEDKDIENLKNQRLLNYIETVVRRYKDNPAVWAWQVENEPFLSFGECPKLDKSFLDEEIKLVRSLSDKPVIVSDSGEFGTWFQAAKRGDIFGSTLYRYVWNRIFGYITYPLPPSFFRLKQGLLRLFVGEKPMIVVELQAEPWMPRALRDIPIEEQFTHFNPAKFREVLEYAEKTGFDIFYFWGVEWWYWLKQSGHPEMWDMAKEAVSSTIKR